MLAIRQLLESEYSKLQEQLHCTNEENNLLQQCLEEKEEKLSVLKGVMDQDKALLEEVSCEYNILKQCLEEKKQKLYRHSEECYHYGYDLIERGQYYITTAAATC